MLIAELLVLEIDLFSFKTENLLRISYKSLNDCDEARLFHLNVIHRVFTECRQ
jgi:hypothetical protein